MVTNTSSSAVTVKIGSVVGYVNGGELTLESGQVVIPKTAVTLIEELDEGTTVVRGSGVYKIEHSAIASSDSATGSEIPAVTDYRYYGANPNNYICLDKNGAKTCPDRSLYRIIGSIYEENAKTNLIKVIKATPLTDGTTSKFSWDYTSSGSFKNNWPISTLMTLLNSGAWWNNTSGSYYNGSTTATMVDFTDKGLTDTAKKMINDSLYYLGGYYSNSVYAVAMYGYERGTTTYNGNALSWTGKVGLMYPSDYGYAAGNNCAKSAKLTSYSSSCYKNDWLYNSSYWQWLISPGSSSYSYVWNVYNDGNLNYNNSGDVTYRSGLVSPVFYLISSVSISSGDGSLNNPYILE